MNNNRYIKQSEAFYTWDKVKKGTLNLCTGFGKTFVSLMVIEHMFKTLNKQNFKCLIIVPTEIIRDDVFPSEFKKFAKEYLLKYCEISCIQSVYKYENTEWDLVVCDEIHNYLYKNGETEYEYFKFFENNKINAILGLSASIDQDRLESLNRIAPIIYRLSLDEAVKLGIVSPFKILNVEVSLTDDEQKSYDNLLRVYKYYENLLGGKWVAFSNSIKFLSSQDETEKKNAIIYRNTIKKRKELVNDCINKIGCTRKILTYFNDENGIIFSESINQCLKIIEGNDKAVSYHSKLKKKERLVAINRLNDKRTKVQYISAVRALNEGLSIDSISFVVVTAGNSKVKDTIQRIGRSCRFVEGKEAWVIRLYVKGTQEEKWVRSSQEEFDKSNIYYLTQEQLWKLLEEKKIIK